jgi:peptidoglycan-associated lipoprotein
MKHLTLMIALAALAAGCSSTPDTKTPVTEAPKSSTPGSGGLAGSSGATTATPGGSVRGTDMAANKPTTRSVYFDFDSNSVKDTDRGTVQAHSKYMADKRDTKIRIEGNCDERGSREYNLALGQRRAESVKKVMTVLGVSDGRIETVSFGEEKPVANGHDEKSWAQNRRADIKYAGE